MVVEYKIPPIFGCSKMGALEVGALSLRMLGVPEVLFQNLMCAFRTWEPHPGDLQAKNTNWRAHNAVCKLQANRTGTLRTILVAPRSIGKRRC